MPNQAAMASGTSTSTQTKPAFWIQVSAPAGILPISVPDVCLQHHRIAAKGAEQSERHDQRHHDLHGGDAEITEPGIQAEREPLHPLGKEEADVRHRRGEVAAADARQQRQDLEHPQRRLLALQGKARADAPE